MIFPEGPALGAIEWRPVPGYERYLLSEYGHAYNADRNRPMKPFLEKNGYFYMTLSRDHTTKRLGVHQWMALTYIGEKPDGDIYDVAHFDGNKLNNHYTNLRWATRRENIHDKWRHSRMANGQKINTNILRPDQVLEIRRRYSPGKRNPNNSAHLAMEFGVSDCTIREIVRRATWKHI